MSGVVSACGRCILSDGESNLATAQRFMRRVSQDFVGSHALSGLMLRWKLLRFQSNHLVGMLVPVVKYAIISQGRLKVYVNSWATLNQQGATH